MTENLYALIPSIKRCRDYHLYDYKGNRFLDMYLDKGRALMGHKPGKAMLPMKNSLEKGLWIPYPSIYEHRLKKQLAKLFPSYERFTFFSNKERAEKTLRTPLCDLPNWKPLESHISGAADSLEIEGPLVITPLIPGLQCVIIADNLRTLPATLLGDTLPPYILEGIIRNFHDYTHFHKEFDNSVWEIFENLKEWERKGPVISYTGVKEDYEKTFMAGLENKILLSPWAEIPSCIPSQLSAYEIKCINSVFLPGENS